MPSIKNQVQKNAERIAQGGDLVQAAGPSNNAANPTPMPPPPPVTGLPVRGYYPQGMTLDQDFGGTSQITRTGPNMRSPTFPKQVVSGVTTVIKSAAAAVSSAVSSLVIKVNNALAPNQTLINFLNGTGMIITTDAQGNLVFNSTSSGDGLTHSTEPWESDPAYNIWREDFFGSFGARSSGWASNGNVVNGWTVQGNIAVPGFSGGIPPYLGQMFWGPSGIINQSSILMPHVLQSINSSSLGGGLYYPDSGMALFDNPGWVLTWVFQYENPRTEAASFDNTHQATYIGLAGITALTGVTSSNPVSRPDVFFGIRYDTSAAFSQTITAVANASAGTTTYTVSGGVSAGLVGRQFTVTGCSTSANNGTWDCTGTSGTTGITLRNPAGVNSGTFGTMASPGIGDTVLTLEAVQNFSYNTAMSRNNTQGTTLSTVAPVGGVWHRLDIICAAAGTITLVLDGTYTLTTAVSKMSVTGSGTWLQGSIPSTNKAELTWTPGNAKLVPPMNPFSVGSQVTVAGFSGTQAPLNGTFTQRISDSSGVGTCAYDLSNAIIGAASVNGSITGYPAVVPAFMVGQDDTANPAAQPRLLVVDLFTLVWNPNLGPNAPGTPDSTKARYW